MTRNRITTTLLTTAFIALFSTSGSGATPGGGLSPQAKPSEVDFPVSCNAAAQQQFNRAVALLHSFWYEEAVKAFTVVTEDRPDCAMGYWGVAMSNWYPLWYPPSAAALKAGSEAVARPWPIGGKTEREKRLHRRDRGLLSRQRKLDHRTRSVAYEKAMEQVYQRYPDDREAAVFYALALERDGAADRQDLRQPEEGRADPQTRCSRSSRTIQASRTISSTATTRRRSPSSGCRRRSATSKIAPAVPHALHMPSHIFTRLGQMAGFHRRPTALLHERVMDYVREASARASSWDQSLHAMDYLEYAYLQTGQDAEAKRVRRRTRWPSGRRPNADLPPHTQWRLSRPATRWSDGTGRRRRLSRAADRHSLGAFSLARR